ncbi:MAG TPA: glycosyltransferase 87 family protein [Actinomycetota bacterium]|nr:glycosyltransferase 87 family protein [Actinomycetota bacterium]
MRTTVLLVCGVMMFAGYLLKAQCLQPWDGRQYQRLCYNDLQALYTHRAIDRGVFPYIHGYLNNGEPTNGAIEYPVLTGVFMWASGKLVLTGNEYLRVSAFLLAPFGLLTAWFLLRMVGWRALLWAAAPALILYSFHNWDLLTAAAAVAGFYAWHRGHTNWAAISFGIGAAFKLFPLFFLAPLFLERWHARDRAGAWSSAWAGFGTFFLINLPFIIANREGWWATFQFHRSRGSDWNVIWQWLPGEIAQFTAPRLNFLSTALIVLSFGIALLFGWRRAQTDGRYPFVQVCGAMLCGFLLWNKVHSPQYALWLLPFFALIGVNLIWWALYSAADLVMYVGIFRWFYDTGYRGVDMGPAKQALLGGLWTRAALLAILIVVFLRARPAEGIGGEPAGVRAPVLSHPPSNVVSVGERQPA